MIIVVCGTTGCGKSSVGLDLAKKLNYQFIDADDYHSEENKNLMRNGIGLNDQNRLSWLYAIRKKLVEWDENNVSGILACSALKRIYRHLLNSGLAYKTNNQDDNQLDHLLESQIKVNKSLNLLFVLLDIDRLTIEKRLAKRLNHDIIKDNRILDSQFSTLEKPLFDENESFRFDSNYLNKETSSTNNTSYYIYVIKDTTDSSIDELTNNIMAMLDKRKNLF